MKIFSFKKSTEVIANWIFWIFFAVAVGGVGIIIVKIANVSVEEASRIPPDLEDELILASRFYNSEKCFVYQDEVGRVHTKVIDASKFIQANMDKCFSESDVKYAFLLKLEQPLPPGVYGPIWTFGTEPIKTFNWPGGFAEKGIIEDVFVMYGNVKYEGNLRIEIKNVE